MLISHNHVWYCGRYSDDDVSFCDGPRMLIYRTAKPSFISTLIALLIHGLIHGFVPVKTWLLIACDIAFYAIITVSTTFTKIKVIFFNLNWISALNIN